MLEKLLALVIVVAGIIIAANLVADHRPSADATGPEGALAGAENATAAPSNGTLAGGPAPEPAAPVAPSPDPGLLDVLTGPLGAHVGEGHSKHKGHG